MVRQALQSLHQRSGAVRRITLERERSFEQRNALLSCPGLAELVGRPAPRPPPLDVGLHLAGAHQLAASAGEAVEEPNEHARYVEEDSRDEHVDAESSSEVGEELDAEYGRGAAAYVRHGFDPLSGRPPEGANPQGSS